MLNEKETFNKTEWEATLVARRQRLEVEKEKLKTRQENVVNVATKHFEKELSMEIDENIKFLQNKTFLEPLHIKTLKKVNCTVMECDDSACYDTPDSTGFCGEVVRQYYKKIDGVLGRYRKTGYKVTKDAVYL